MGARSGNYLTFMSVRVDYGIDAPGVIRNLLVLGAVILAASLLVPPFHVGSALVDLRGFWLTGSPACFSAA